MSKLNSMGVYSDPKDFPNLNVSGLRIDIADAILKHVRGPAAAGGTAVLALVYSDITKFVSQLNEAFNIYFGKEPNDPNKVF